MPRRPITCRLVPAFLTEGHLSARALADALAAYGDDHAASSLRRVLSTWRGFCRWLVAEGELGFDPSVHIEGPGRADWKPKALELVELGRVIDAASTSDPRGRDPWPERDRALVAVFAGAGVRIGEAISLRVNDVEARDRSPRLRVYGKGGRRRVVPVGPEVIEAVDAYLLSRRDRLGPYSATDKLFVRSDGRLHPRDPRLLGLHVVPTGRGRSPTGLAGPRPSTHLRHAAR